MRMTGTEKSFKAWAEAQTDKEIFWHWNIMREGQGDYSVKVPEIGMNWRGDAQDVKEATTLAVEDYEKRRKNPAKMKPVSELTPGQLNKRLESLQKKSSRITEKFIRAGRGSERPSEIWKMTDELAREYQYNQTLFNNVHDEITRRYGPGVHRAPVRGRNPVRKNPYPMKKGRHNKLLLRDDLKPAAALFRKSVDAAKKHSNIVAAAFNEYGDHGPQISGVIRDHFPNDVKDKLRKLARDSSRFSDAAEAARPKGVRTNTMWKLSQAVADKYGHAFYGPQPTRRKNPVRKNPRKGNPVDYGDRWIIVGGELYEVMLLDDNWKVVHVEGGVGTSIFNAGTGDGGFNAAMLHLKDMKAKGSKKNPLPRLPNPAKRFTKKQLDALRKGFAGIESVDPAQPTYTKLTFMLDSYSPAMLKQIAGAKIKFLSSLARNRLKKENPRKTNGLAPGITGPWILAAWDVRRVVYYGKGKWTPNRSKANVYKTEGRAKISAKLVVDEWNIQVAVANTATTHKQLQAALRPKK